MRLRYALAAITLIALPVAAQPTSSVYQSARDAGASPADAAGLSAAMRLSTEEARLVSDTPGTGAAFGLTVSLSSDRAAVGAFTTNQRTPVYVFVRSGATWTQEAQLMASDTAVGDRFGEHVSLSGDRLLVGAAGANGSGLLGVGAVYVFVRSGNTWTQEAKLGAATPGSFDFFGTVVALSGDRALVRAAGADGGTFTQGQVTVFVRSGSTWTEEAMLSAPDLPNQFGLDLALSGDRALVGALGNDDDPGNDPFVSGIGYVFVRSGSTWTLEDKLTVPDRFPSDQIAMSVSLSGDHAVLGAPGENDQTGAAYVFSRSGNVWSQDARLTATDRAMDDRFGTSVSLDDSLLLIGASNVSGGGQVYLFGQNPDGSWMQRETLRASDSRDNDRFGGSVSLDGGRALVGATGSGSVTNAGAAYVFADVRAVSAEDAPQAIAASLSAPSPNPVSGRVRLVLTTEAPETVRAVIVDALGRDVRVVMDGEVSGATTLAVETATLAPGVYTVRVSGTSGTLTQRLTVIR